MANERKLNNYTVVYGAYVCWDGDHEAPGSRSEGLEEWCPKCYSKVSWVPVARLAHVKADSLVAASKHEVIGFGRFIAAFEGHITGLLG